MFKFDFSIAIDLDGQHIRFGDNGANFFSDDACLMQWRILYQHPVH